MKERKNDELNKTIKIDRKRDREETQLQHKRFYYMEN